MRPLHLQLPPVAPRSSTLCHLPILPQACLRAHFVPSLVLLGLILLAYKMGMMMTLPAGVRAVSWAPTSSGILVVTTVSSTRPAKASFLFLPHPDLWHWHYRLGQLCLPGVPRKQIPEGLVAAWGHIGRKGSTPGQPDPTHIACPQTHRV